MYTYAFSICTIISQAITYMFDHLRIKKKIIVAKDCDATLVGGICGLWMFKKYPTSAKFHIDYIFNFKRYTYIADTYDYTWPPATDTSAKFSAAIKAAISKNRNGEDVTHILKRYAGPRGDFHGKSVHVRDVFGDDYIAMEDALGERKLLKPDDSF